MIFFLKKLFTNVNVQELVKEDLYLAQVSLLEAERIAEGAHAACVACRARIERLSKMLEGETK